MRFLLILLLTITTAPSVRTTLERALDNEREAVARYQLYAAKAESEGFLGAASLFKAAARAEQTHAQRIENAMRERGLPVPEPREYALTAAETSNNLRSSANAETQERDGFYHDAIEACQKAGDADMVKMFDQTRDTEVEHANLLNAAARNLNGMKQGHAYFVCEHCGYTTDIELPMCALCRKNARPRRVE